MCQRRAAAQGGIDNTKTCEAIMSTERVAIRLPRKLNLVLALLGCALISACIPQQHHVRAGVDPRNMDRDVRFRATYYFRVFDYCDKSNGGTTGREVLSDSLYRFRMTGKASALSNKVHFESGTLKAWQIDPFGTTVAYNFKAQKFEYQSPQKASSEATPTPAEKGKDATPAQTDCEGGHAGQGFRIYGPEGWVPYDLDERLLLAMSSSGQPLIDTISELADRVLGNKGSPLANQQAVLREQTATLRARSALTAPGDTDTAKRLSDALEAFS
jgi:hypothetical protein